MRKKMSKRCALALLCIGGFWGAGCGDAAADSHYWVATSDTWWDYGSNWSLTEGGTGGAGQPTNGDYAFLIQSGSTDREAWYYNDDYPDAVLSALRIDGTGDGNISLVHRTYSHPLASAYEYVGYSGTGSHLQPVGSNTISNYLYLGYNSGSSGTYELSGTGSLTADLIYIGYNGRGTFTQTGGAVTIPYLYFNTNDYSNSGTYTLNGGTLYAASMSNRGSGGASSIFFWNGGDLLPASGSLSIAVDEFYLVSEATGNLNKSFDSSYSFYSDRLIVGLYGTATFTQNGAYCPITEYLSLGPQGTGTYNLQNGTLGSSSARLIMAYAHYGNDALATFNQTGGTATFGSGLSYLAEAYNTYRGTSTAATYNLSGSASSLATDSLLLGSYYHSYGSMSGTGDAPAVSGHFNQYGGSHTVASDLRLGDYYFDGGASAGEPLPTLEAMYSLSGGTLEVQGNLTIGYSGYLHSIYTTSPSLQAEFSQSGGEVSVDGELQVGKDLYDASYVLDDGSLTAASELIREGGEFWHNNGINTVTSSLTLESGGGYQLEGGTLNAASVVVNDGSFNQAGGTLNATTFTQNDGTVSGILQNQGSFRYYGGDFAGRLWNQGSVSFYADFTAENGVQNDNSFYVGSKRTVTVNGEGLTNNGSIDLAGGTLQGGGPILNYGFMSADEGTIGGSGSFTNYGLLNQGYGALTLADSYLNLNYGTIELRSGYQLRLTGSDLDNLGTLALNGAIVSGSAGLVNLNGGTVSGPGTVLCPFNNNGGRLLVEPGTTTIATAFTNSGLVQLSDYTASLTGGLISNSGTIEGLGQIGNDIDNGGIIEALGGTLTLGGGVINSAAGMMTAGSGSKLLVTNGLAANSGLVNLTGGTFDNNGQSLTNIDRISGYGILRSGGLTNNGDVLLTGGITTVNGPVTNNGIMEVAHNGAIFTDDFTNYGVFKTTDTTVSFGGTYTEYGSYISDPSDNVLVDLVVEASGYLVGGEENGVYDRWFLSNNFVSHSERNSLWNTIDAMLAFTSGMDSLHDLYLTGADYGALPAGFADNFAWGYLDIGRGNSLTLYDGNALAGGALYVEALSGIMIENGLVANISGDLNIYYLAGLSENSYLAGLDYDFLDGDGRLIAVAGAGDATPTPLPATVWLLGAGLAGLAQVRRKARRPERN